MRILLAIDGSACSDAAVSAVITQYVRDDVEVLVVHTDDWPRNVPIEWSYAEGPSAAQELVAYHARRLQEADGLVAAAAARLNAAGFRTRTSVRVGDARQQIVDCAREWAADLIVLGSHGYRGVDRLLLGSVSEHVVRNAPCSVEVVRRQAAR
jgi:nucleotide-binding universal stress UspA family protein